MAKKRMFNNEVLDTDAFLDMPLSAQALYFHLNLRADDDGFISQPKRVQRYVGASDDDLRILVSKRFLITFDDGVIVIKHWRMHNTIQKDRYNITNYIEDLRMLGLKHNKAYTTDISQMVVAGDDLVEAKCIQNGNKLETKKIQDGNKLETECIQNVSSDLDIGIDKELDIDKDKNKNKDIEKIKDIVSYLNYVCGKNYKYSTENTKKHISARLAEGFTVDDFKTVISSKHDQWSNDDKMKCYLRPDTLFGTKFESYLQNAIPNKIGCNNPYDDTDTDDGWQ